MWTWPCRPASALIGHKHPNNATDAVNFVGARAPTAHPRLRYLCNVKWEIRIGVRLQDYNQCTRYLIFSWNYVTTACSLLTSTGDIQPEITWHYTCNLSMILVVSFRLSLTVIVTVLFPFADLYTNLYTNFCFIYSKFLKYVCYEHNFAIHIHFLVLFD